MGIAFLRAGDGFSCPKCKMWSTLIKSQDHVILDGKAVAYVGDHFTCGATLIPKQAHVVGTHPKTVSFSQQQKNKQYSLTQSFLGNRIRLEEHGLQFQLINKKFNLPISGCFYLLTTNDGQEYSGFTDHDGFTETLRTGIKSEQVSLHIFDFSQPMNEWV
ncbi:PAAR domain-containing protein [Acinetobacter towneri]